MVRVQPSALERDRSQGARIGNDQDSAAPSPASFGRPPLVDTDGWGDAPDLAEPFPPPAGSGRRRPSCRSISSQAAMVSRSCRCRCSTASSSCWARSSRGGCGGGLPPSPSPAFPRSTPAASRSPSSRMGVVVPLSCPARRRGRKLSSCVTSSRKRVWTDVYCASVCGAEGRCGGRHGAQRWASGL